jgi:hypothetical protein
MKRRDNRALWGLYSALAFLSVVVLIIITPVCACVTLFAASAIPHNIRLGEYENQFDTIQHPPDTVLIARQRGINQSSWTNHCGYFVGELRRYSGFEGEIASFYGQQPKVQAFGYDFEIEFLRDQELPVDILPYEFGSLQDWGVGSDDLVGKVYLVFIWPVGESWFDYRCR